MRARPVRVVSPPAWCAHQVLEAQSSVGFKLPEPPVRKRPGIAEAKKIAAEAREREKAAGRRSGW